MQSKENDNKKTGVRGTINQTTQTGNPLSNQTSKPGNQADYEPGQLVEESNKAEGHTGNRGPY